MDPSKEQCEGSFPPARSCVSLISLGSTLTDLSTEAVFHFRLLVSGSQHVFSPAPNAVGVTSFNVQEEKITSYIYMAGLFNDAHILLISSPVGGTLTQG